MHSQKGESGAIGWGEEFCHFAQLGGSDGLYALRCVRSVVDGIAEEKALAHIDGHILAVVGADEELAAILGLDFLEQALGHRGLSQVVEFTLHYG